MRPTMQKTASAVVAMIGLALLVMMIIVEDEPGAIPLALLAIGAIGYFSARPRPDASRHGIPARPDAVSGERDGRTGY